jgi:hypothetical protein
VEGCKTEVADGITVHHWQLVTVAVVAVAVPEGVIGQLLVAEGMTEGCIHPLQVVSIKKNSKHTFPSTCVKLQWLVTMTILIMRKDTEECVNVAMISLTTLRKSGLGAYGVDTIIGPGYVTTGARLGMPSLDAAAYDGGEPIDDIGVDTIVPVDVGE